MSQMFAAMSERNYRFYVTGALLSNIGTWMQRVAQDWFVLELSGSGAAVGLTTALQFLPTLFLSPYAGLLADRFDKRKLLYISQSWMAVCAAVLGVLAITGNAGVGHVYLLALLFGVGSALDVPARQAFVSEVAGPDHLANAIGLNSASFHTARLIGPAVAGLVIHQWGSGWAILTNAFTYAAFLGGLMLMDAGKLIRSPRAPRGGGLKQLAEGVRYVRQRSDILLVLVVVFFVGTFGMNFQMTNALMAQQEFGKGAQEYGILGTAMAVGSLSGALIGARRRSAPRLRFVVGAAITFGVLELISGLMPSYLTFGLSLPLVGLAAVVTMTAANACVQMSVDPRLRGRVMAIYMMVVMGGTPVGAPLLGWVGDVLGPPWTLIIGGGVTALGAAVAALVLLRRKRLVMSPTLLPRPHLNIHHRHLDGVDR
ncbi:MAG: MFS transporter [Propionibacteriales bacterium]|nr:MFS transporter [Propionibacteriales bacterium]